MKYPAIVVYAMFFVCLGACVQPKEKEIKCVCCGYTDVEKLGLKGQLKDLTEIEYLMDGSKIMGINQTYSWSFNREGYAVRTYHKRCSYSLTHPFKITDSIQQQLEDSGKRVDLYIHSIPSPIARSVKFFPGTGPFYDTFDVTSSDAAPGERSYVVRKSNQCNQPLEMYEVDETGKKIPAERLYIPYRGSTHLAIMSKESHYIMQIMAYSPIYSPPKRTTLQESY